jgi:hypothetical protein
MTKHPLRQRVGREVVKSILGRMLSWRQMKSPVEGFSIILGVPWDLRHLLSVNLQFVAKTDLTRLNKLFVVFDRRSRSDMVTIEEKTRREFPSLPLEFLCYPDVSGWIIEKVHVSTFYNSMNTTLAIGRCATKHVVLHDFDLYPLRDDHFTSIVDAMQKNQWRFAGHELTHFDGLNDEDLQIGTWTLGIDLEWLRSQYRPIDCFHSVASHAGRTFNLDPFAWIQFQTPARGLTEGFDETSFCHVKNLCSTYLRLLKRAPLKVAWRLHYLWYLEYLSGNSDRLGGVIQAMQCSKDGILLVDQYPADFRDTHASCGNVLRRELQMMEQFLYGETRENVQEYLNEFDRFIHKFGDVSEIRDAAGTVMWTPRFRRDGLAFGGELAQS